MTVAAERTIRNILRMIQDSEGKEPSAILIENIHANCRSALELLKEGADPFEETIGFIMLAIRRSTAVEQKVVNGKLITRVTYKNLDMFYWAIAEAHKLPYNDADA